MASKDFGDMVVNAISLLKPFTDYMNYVLYEQPAEQQIALFKVCHFKSQHRSHATFHLHCHTQFSLLDGAADIKKL
ncbi:hypothetical protein PEC18_39495, partial [Paucibacter sp. O1-1]|nr:hypothetical protein [Paucibacter sp. O1-1]MDA3831698.1 hypothetical protein [Paucibacter sp. O1-1]